MQRGVKNVDYGDIHMYIGNIQYIYIRVVICVYVKYVALKICISVRVRIDIRSR